jgi:hypothetical protein
MQSVLPQVVNFLLLPPKCRQSPRNSEILYASCDLNVIGIHDADVAEKLAESPLESMFEAG